MMLRIITSIGALIGLCLIVVPSLAQETASFSDLVAQAAAAGEQNNVPLAVDLYSKALKINPNWAQGWWFIGFLQYNSGQFAPARDALTHFLDFGPDPQGFALRGMCEFETGEYSDSLADIQRGLSLGAADEPRNEEALHFYEAMLLTRLGKFDQGLRSYVYFAQRQVVNQDVLLAIGLAGLRMPLLPSDVKADQKALLLDTGAAVYAFMTREPKAAAAFDTLFQQFPSVVNLHYLYGSLLYAQDSYAAQEQFQAELKTAPSNTEARIMIAWILLMRNQPDEALPYAQDAVRRQPDSASAQLVLGKSLSETSDPAAGLEHLKRALQLDPDNLEVHIALAGAYSQSGQMADARREYSWCQEATKDGRNRLALP
ncbi:MAG TPA: tetratricopeptide repeat protein [Terriglobales bacterium]